MYKEQWSGEDQGGGRGVHLSAQMHQEHTFRDRSACRTPAESGEEDLTSGEEYTDPRRTRTLDSETADHWQLQPKDTLAEWMQTQDPYIRGPPETHFRPKDTGRLKARGWKNTFQ